MYCVYLCSRGKDGINPFEEINGVSLLERVYNQCNVMTGVMNVFITNNKSDKRIGNLFPNSKVILVPERTLGAAASALYGMASLDASQSVWLMSTNELVNVDMAHYADCFVEKGADVGVLTFKSTSNKYSYVKEEGGEVLELSQYDQISNLATTGAFWFSSSSIFIEAAMALIKKRASVNGLYYVAPSINQVILSGKRVVCSEIDRADYYPAKNRKDILAMEMSFHGGK